MILDRSTRASSGLNQIELTLRFGIAGSSLSLIEHGKREPPVATLAPLLRATRHSVVTIPTVRSDTAHIAAEMSDLLVADEKLASDKPVGDAFGAFRRFLQRVDILAAEHGATRVGLTEPAPTGSLHWDTAIAALCEYRLAADGLPVLEWIGTRTGSPNDPRTPPTSDNDIPGGLAQVPPEFLARRNHSPFSPGSDSVPEVWSGRTEQLSDWRDILRSRRQAGLPERGRSIFGEAGLGKCTLVRRIARDAAAASD